MSEYKVVNVSSLDNDLKRVADSIRAKSGTGDKLIFPDGYIATVDNINKAKPEQEKTVDIIENGTTEVTPDEGKVLSKVTVNVDVPVPEGYIKPSGTKEITENGTHDVTEYSSVNVNVPSSGGGDDTDIEKLEDFISNEMTGSFESERITSITQYAFGYKTKLTSISLPNLRKSNTRAFTNCDSLVSLSIPNVTGYTYQYMCAYCSALKTIDVKQVSDISSYSFQSCSSLTTLEFNQVDTIASNAFNGASSLKTLILRSTSVVTLSNTNAFAGTKIAGTGGYIYTYLSLIEDFKVATNWSTYAKKFRVLAPTVADLENIDGITYSKVWVDSESALYTYSDSGWTKGA